MAIIFHPVTAQFRGNEAATQLEAGCIYTLQIAYFRATGMVSIFIIGTRRSLQYASWAGLMEDWVLSGTLY